MPQLVSDGTMLYRINLAKNRIELARSGGTQWVYRSAFGRKGNLRDLLWYHYRLFALSRRIRARKRRFSCPNCVFAGERAQKRAFSCPIPFGPGAFLHCGARRNDYICELEI